MKLQDENGKTYFAVDEVDYNKLIEVKIGKRNCNCAECESLDMAINVLELAKDGMTSLMKDAGVIAAMAAMGQVVVQRVMESGCENELIVDVLCIFDAIETLADDMSGGGSDDD